MTEKTIVEINGVKLEIDLSTARRIDEFKIGDNVKLLVKEYSAYKSCPAVIIGFDNFKNLPTIIVAYLEMSYSSGNIKFAYINSQSTDFEVCHMNHHEKLFDKTAAVDMLDREIVRAEIALNELKAKKTFFCKQYNIVFKESDSFKELLSPDDVINAI